MLALSLTRGVAACWAACNFRKGNWEDVALGYEDAATQSAAQNKGEKQSDMVIALCKIMLAVFSSSLSSVRQALKAAGAQVPGGSGGAPGPGHRPAAVEPAHALKVPPTDLNFSTVCSFGNSSLGKQVEVEGGRTLNYRCGVATASDLMRSIAQSDKRQAALSQASEADRARSVEAARSRMGETASRAPAAALQAAWEESQRRMGSGEGCLAVAIQDVATVLREAVMPTNKYTRRSASETGNSIHLPGIIRAETSNNNYKKVFSRKLAGGKAEYSVALLLDVSTSMRSTARLHHALQGFLAVVGALEAMEITSYAVLLFSDTVQLVKAHDGPWDAACALALFGSVLAGRNRSLDGEALHVALDVLDQMGWRGKRLVFTFTDGHATSVADLLSALHRAEEAGVQARAEGGCGLSLFPT